MFQLGGGERDMGGAGATVVPTVSQGYGREGAAGAAVVREPERTLGLRPSNRTASSWPLGEEEIINTVSVR